MPVLSQASFARIREIASRYQVSRGDQDVFAAASQQRAVRAIADGRFKEEIVPVPLTAPSNAVPPA